MFKIQCVNKCSIEVYNMYIIDASNGQNVKLQKCNNYKFGFFTMAYTMLSKLVKIINCDKISECN